MDRESFKLNASKSGKEKENEDSKELNDKEPDKLTEQPEKLDKRRSARASRKQTQEVSKPLDNWFYKGDTKDKAKRNVSTVSALDLNESDSQFMVYAAMVHHAADSFIEQDASDKPPSLEAEGKEDSPPELHIESTAVESPKDRLPTLSAEANIGSSVKDKPPELESEITQPTICNKRPVKRARRYNPAACDSRELDILTSLDLSPIKVSSSNNECSKDVSDEIKTDTSKEKSSKKRKLNQVDSSSSILQWIEASNVSKPAKRSRKDDRNSFSGNNSSSGKQWKLNDDGTFVYKNITYRQPRLLLLRVKDSPMNGSHSPVKALQSLTMRTSTPNISQMKKVNKSSASKENEDSTSDISDISAAKSDKSRSLTQKSRRSSPKKTSGRCIRPSLDLDDENSARSELTERKRGRTPKKRISSVSKGKGNGKNMDPVVLVKSCDYSNGGNQTKEKVNSGVRRTINLNSDGNESDEDSRSNQNKDNEYFPQSSGSVRSASDIIETFSIDSDSEDESFAPMQAAVDSLLTDLPGDETSSPRKKNSKRGVTNGSKKKSSDSSKLQETKDSDDDGDNLGSSNYSKPKTAEEKFDELMGFSNGAR